MTAAAIPFDPAQRAEALGVPPQVLNSRGEIDWPKIMLGFVGMSLGQFMAMLDIQIVNSSLTQIQSGLSASADEISWIQTVYLLAEVITIPLAAYVSKLFGTRNFYIAATSAFVATSMLVGLSANFESMIFFRALQGMAAGLIIPAGFATAMSVFPPDKRITANIAFGVVVSLAPTIGPTLGGHLTDLLSWRWLFFLNLFPGALIIFLMARWGDFDEPDPSLARGIDWFGLVMMTIFLLTLQYAIEEGSDDGWFQDPTILWLSITAAVTGVVFIWRQLTYRQPIVSLRPFTNREFSIGVLLNFVTGAALFGGGFLIPVFLGQVKGYTASQVGTTVMVAGAVMFVTAPICQRIVRYTDLRVSMLIGFLLCAWATALGGRVTQDWGFHEFAIMQGWRSVGVVLAMTASTQLAVSTLPVSMMKDASGMLALVRNFGGAVGLAGVISLMNHQTAVHMADLRARMSYGNLQSQSLLEMLTGMMQERGAADPEGAAMKALDRMIHREGTILSYGDAFYVMAAGCVLAACLTLLTRPPKNFGQLPPEVH
ncbi:MAG: DHA2 family efflux MFS transporter permease subunit [Phenylobacterium sp.]